MKKELGIQLMLLAVAVCLLLLTLYKQREIVPTEIQHKDLQVLEQRASDLPEEVAVEEGEEVLPVPTPYPADALERETVYR